MVEHEKDVPQKRIIQRDVAGWAIRLGDIFWSAVLPTDCVLYWASVSEEIKSSVPEQASRTEAMCTLSRTCRSMPTNASPLKSWFSNHSFCLFKVGFIARTKPTKMFVNYFWVVLRTSDHGLSNKKKFMEKESVEQKLQLIQYVVFSQY